MPDEVKYYSVTLASNASSDPSGLFRRQIFDNGGIRDEALKRDLAWGRTPLIAAAERGDMTLNLVEVSEEEAERIIERFRAKWGAEG